MNKRRLFAIVLFIAVGFFMFTFANPNDRVREGQNNDSSETTRPASETEDVENTVVDDDNVNNNQSRPVVIDLTADKEAAKEEIRRYSETVVLSDDTKKTIVDDAYTKIDDATSIDEINQIVEDTKKALDDAAKEELDNYKEAAKEEINEYAKDVDLDDAKKEEIKTDAFEDIDNATTKEEVDKIVEDTKKALDDASLEEYKASAIEELKEYKKDEKYTEENQEVVNNIKTTGIENITNAETKEEVDNILSKAKEDIDAVKILTYIVTFKDFFGAETKVEVEHDTLVTAPEFTDVVERDITHSFIGFDKDLTQVVTGDMVVTANYEITKVEANIYRLHDGIAIPDQGKTAGKTNYDYKGKIELDLTKPEVKKEVLNRINKNVTKNLTQDEETIKSYVVGTLPESNNTEYVYTYYVLKFEYKDGFHIDYARFVNNAPVITLEGETEIEVYEQKGHYDFTKGFSVSDDHSALTNDDVQIKIIKNGQSQVQKVNYEKVGTYVISYTATDAEGNTTTVTRTVKVLANTLNSIALSSNNDTYEYDASLNLTVNGTYADGSVKPVEFTIEGFDTKVVGNGTATVKVEGFEDLTYNYTVLNKLVSLELSSNNDTYEYGDKLNLTVNANYVNGLTVENVEYTINEFKNTTVGTHEATISFEGVTTTYTYTILNKLVKLELSSNNDTYLKGASMKNLTVKAYYINGEEIDNVKYTIDRNTQFNTTTVGKKTMKINALDNTLTYSYTVNYSDADLKTLFKNTTASLSFNFDHSKITFYNLPENASVVSVRREDYKTPIKLNKTSKRNVFEISWGDYDTLRHNWGYDIHVTYSVNNQSYTRVYGESFGDID